MNSPFLTPDVKPGGWFDLGLDAGSRCAGQARVELDPPETALAEVYRVPTPGFGARGADIDRKGVVWVRSAAAIWGSFDRRKCKGPLNGPRRLATTAPRAGVPSVSGSGLQGHRREQRRVELLLVGRSAQHVRSG